MNTHQDKLMNLLKANQDEHQKRQREAMDTHTPRETLQEREYKRLYLKASAQRDELLAALKRVYNCNDWATAREYAQAAIAKAEGSAK